MAGTTPHYGLTTLGSGDDIADDSYKFADQDRRLIDLLLWLGAEGHHHTGDPASAIGAPTAPALTLITSGGGLAAGERFFYKVAIVDENGLESAASDEVYVDTPTPIAAPAAPTLVAYDTGGTLLPGNYFYVLSAYTDTNTQETQALAAVYVTIPTGSSTNRVELEMPTPPAGADGFNIFRKKPGGTEYDYLASIPVATTSYVDDGSVAEDCNRTVLDSNASGSDNGVLVEFPDTLESGQTWKIYRTDVSGDYANSLLYHVVEETAEGSGIITPEYEDVGDETSVGSPQTASQSVGSPSQVDLVTETTGTLPAARVEQLPTSEVVTFAHSGAVEPITGSFVWVCEHPTATIIGVRAALGRGSTPDTDPVIIDVLKGTDDPVPTYSTIFTDLADQPVVAVGEQVGVRVPPTVVGASALLEGESLSIDIIQSGGGAIPTDVDLLVTIYLSVPTTV